METDKREYRSFDFKTGSGDYIIEGYAAKFNEPSQMMVSKKLGPFYEIIHKGAFDKADMGDVVLNYGHQGKPIARTKNGSLTLKTDSVGLYIKADLSGTEYGRQTYEEVQSGLIDKMSFAFAAQPDGDSYERRSRTRHVQKIAKVFDVALVTSPAYTQTEVSARSYFAAQAAIEERERQKQKIRILTEVF